jgi:cation transport regulator
MPDRINADLPPAYSIICRRMPETFVVQLFNHAFAAHSGDPHQEEVAHRIAWAAVKRGYMKADDGWIRKIADGFYPRGI